MSPDFDKIDILKAELQAAGYVGDTCSAKGPATTPNSDYDWLGNDIRIAGPRGTFTYRSRSLEGCWQKAWDWAFCSGGCEKHEDGQFEEICRACREAQLTRKAKAWEHLARYWRRRAAEENAEATAARRAHIAAELDWCLWLATAAPGVNRSEERKRARMRWRDDKYCLTDEQRAQLLKKHPWLEDR